MSCAMNQQRQCQNYQVKTLHDNVELNKKYSIASFHSEYKKYCGLDEFISPNIRNMDINKKFHNVPRGSCKVEKESELIGMLSKQLYLAGNQMERMQTVLKKAEERLKIKDQEIGRLKRKVREWEVKSRNQESIHKREIQKRQSQIDSADFVHKKCLKLETKIIEMEKFLSDYGLVWVGANRSKSPPKTPEVSNDFINSCYSQLNSNIQELNLSVGKDEMHVHHSQGGASFKSASCMTLKFYKNGMIVQKGRLRSYADPETRSFIQDILDGYFPSELQNDYPEGVPFKVEDHRTEMYLGEGATYPGHGYQLGKVSQLRSPGSANVKSRLSSPKRCQTPKQRIKSNSSLTRMPFSARLSNHESIAPPKIPSSARLPETDLGDLRSQILASHNNNCSDTHLQSHLNAELSSTCRSEKKACLSPNNTECNLQLSDHSSPSKDTNKIPQAIKNRLSSMYRSSFNVSSSPKTDVRGRAKSASFSGSRFSSRPPSRSSANELKLDIPKNVRNLGKVKNSKLKGLKIVVMERPKNEFPILREINPPTGDIEELQLKVRSLNGSTVYLVHISADDTVARLYQLLDKVMLSYKKRMQRGYRIVVSGYSPKRLDHLGVSLRDYGICRNCVLHLVND